MLSLTSLARALRPCPGAADEKQVHQISVDVVVFATQLVMATFPEELVAYPLKNHYFLAWHPASSQVYAVLNGHQAYDSHMHLRENS